MTRDASTEPPTKAPPQQAVARAAWWRTGLRALRILLPIAVLIGAGLGMRWFMQHGAHAKRRKARQKAVLVQVTRLSFGTQRVEVTAMGRVRAAREVDLHPRVRGEVLSISPELIPGGRVPKGQVLLRIDASDYRVAVLQAQSAVQQAEADLRIEQGRQVIAKKELQFLHRSAKKADRDLVLRGPQLRKAKATTEAARAALGKARLDLGRTVIRAPWNAVVQARLVNVGSRVTETDSLVKLVGTDAYWVQLAVPVDELRWILGKAGGVGAPVRIRDTAAWPPGHHRTGRVIRLAPDLEEKGRMAQVIVQVDDPLALRKGRSDRPRLLLGAWVEARIGGRKMTAVARVPRKLIHHGDKMWCVDAKGRLDIRRVVIVHRGPQQVLVARGVSDRDRIVTSDISTPVQGMLLRVLKTPAPAAGKRKGQ